MRLSGSAKPAGGVVGDGVMGKSGRLTSVGLEQGGTAGAPENPTMITAGGRAGPLSLGCHGSSCVAPAACHHHLPGATFRRGWGKMDQEVGRGTAHSDGR